MADRLSTMQASRTEKLEALQAQNIEPYPPKINRSHNIADARQGDGLTVTVVGRIMAWRGHGKLQFIDIQDESGKIQLAFKSDLLPEDKFETLKLLDLNDFIEVSGTTFTTHSGEKTVQATDYRIISKAINPLPSLWYGLKDKEERFRKRYLDLLLSPEVKQTLDKRWAVERAVREYLWSQDYKEVETPVLQNLYGGTNARPFTTHLNALDIDMYLRVAPELYLKRLVVGGYERIFEIARNFRNEGMDQTHQPEFTMMELYEAYADYHRIMDLTENLFKHVAHAVNGSLQLKVEDNEVDLSGNWQRITVDEALKTYAGLDWETISDEEIKNIIAEKHIEVPGVYSRDKALFVIFDHLVPEHLIQPTWVIDYPQEVSPLARTHRSKPGRVERFEGYIGGKEICDGWSEIVSAIEQRSRFENEQKNLKAGDTEAQPLDEEFLEALAHGCPPLGGIGIGIDRLVMFMTNTWSIREIIAFPLMRPEKGKTKTDSKYSIGRDVKELFPDISYAVVSIKGVNIAPRADELEAKKKETTEQIKYSVDEVGQLPTIQAYRTVFKKTHVWGDGRRPSPEALLRRIAQGKGLYTVNTAVDAYNLAVIETGIGLGGFDASTVKVPVTLRLTQENEEMKLLGDNGDVTKTKAGEIAYSDAEKLLTLDLNYRDIDFTKITTDTKDIFLFADGAPGIDREQIAAALRKGAEYIQKYCGGEIGEIQVIE